jgi:hypothetical protein
MAEYAIASYSIDVRQREEAVVKIEWVLYGNIQVHYQNNHSEQEKWEKTIIIPVTGTHQTAVVAR